jgi:hypothetical protein
MIGLTSSTTTVTPRTANVLAMSSPIPDEPKDGQRLARTANIAARTSRDKNHLFSPIKLFGCEENISSITVERRQPFDEPFHREVSSVDCHAKEIGSQKTDTRTK